MRPARPRPSRDLLRRVINRLGLGVALLPLLVWAGAMGLTLLLGAHGCRIDEGSAHPCDLWGRDLSQTAYTVGFLAAWGPLLLLPITGWAAILWGLGRLLLWIFRPRDAS